MLRARRDFEAIRAVSKSRAHPLLVIRYVPRDRDVTRFGLSTARRVGGAVVRNRVRRRIRESLRRLGPQLQGGWDVLIVARPASATATSSELQEALERLLRMAGVMEGNGRNA